MDPKSLDFVGTALSKAFDMIEKLADNADKLEQDDVKYYITYIEIAKQALNGLEEEYIEILLEAANCQISDMTQRAHLLLRINRYIHGEKLRPKLKDAIDRLSEGRQALKEHAEDLLLWGRPKRNREAALNKFDELLMQLTGYLGSLGEYSGPSAVALDDIEKIKTVITNSPEDFENTIDDLLMNLDKSRLLSITGDCGRVIEVLRLAFR
jgi:hypothetical protein